MTVSIRSYLAAGVATAAVGAIAIVPIEQTAAQTMGARLYQLSASVQSLVQPANAAAAVLGAISSNTPATTNPAAATSTGVSVAPAAAAAPAAAVVSSASIPTPPPLIWPSDSLLQSAGDAIINIYNAFEPWFQWGWSVVAWAAGWVPIVGFFAQQINIAYATVEPIVGALVYSFAYLIDGQADLIPQILSNGVSAAWNNFIQGEIAWFESFLPPLPPIGSVFGAAATTAAAPLAASALEAPTEAAASGVAGFKHATGVASSEVASSEVDSTASATSSTVVTEETATANSPVATDPTASDSTTTTGPVDQAGTSDEVTVATEANTSAPTKSVTAAPRTNTTQAKSSTSAQAGGSDSASTDKTADKADTSKSTKSGTQKSTGHSPKARSAAKSGSN